MLDPKRTLAIVCGASDWPKLKNFDGASAFANSAEAIRGYFMDRDGLDLASRNVLWLFDLTDAVAQYRRIIQFLTRRLRALAAPTGRNVLVLFVYVGHGAFFGSEREYCLLVRDTQAPIETDTSLRVTSLSRLLRTEAAESSRILVLDCCFAGEAAHYFQSALEQVVAAKTTEVVEEAGADRGVAILCASSARNPARLEDVSSYTLFGREFVRALAVGDPSTAGPMDLRTVCRLVSNGLKSLYGEDSPRPEVHVPDQAGGDLASVPLFPNVAAPFPGGEPRALARQAIDLSAHVRVMDVDGDAHALAPVAGVMALEASLSIQGRPRRLSARYVAEKVFQLSQTRNGATFEQVCQVLQRSGSPLESSWPFIPQNYDLPDRKRMEELDKEAEQYQARIWEVRSFADLLESLEAGRPVLAAAPWFKEWYAQFHPTNPKADGHLAVPKDPSEIMGMQPIVITAWDPAGGRVRFANTFGADWGHAGFGSFNKDDASTMVNAEAMWAVEAVDRTAPFRW